MTRHAVLILSGDPLAAAMLGAAVDLAGHLPRFPDAGEAARGALLRVRQMLALIDCDHWRTTRSPRRCTNCSTTD